MTEKLQDDYDEFIFKKTGKTKEDRSREAREAHEKVTAFFKAHTEPVTGEILASGLGDGESFPTLCAIEIFSLVKAGAVSYDSDAKTWQAVKKPQV